MANVVDCGLDLEGGMSGSAFSSRRVLRSSKATRATLSQVIPLGRPRRRQVSGGTWRLFPRRAPPPPPPPPGDLKRAGQEAGKRYGAARTSPSRHALPRYPFVLVSSRPVRLGFFPGCAPGGPVCANISSSSSSSSSSVSVCFVPASSAQGRQ